MKHWIVLALVALLYDMFEHPPLVLPSKSWVDKLSADNTVIVFDWHQVVQEQKFSRIARKLSWRHPGMLKLFLRPQAWKTVKSLLKKHTVAEKIVEELEILFPQIGSLKEPFMQVLVEEPLIEPTIELLKALSKCGYPLYMLSNIAPETLEKLKMRHPDVLALFKGIYTPCKENGYIQKPNLRFYELFKKFLKRNGDGKKNIIFIDDRARNVEAAASVGMYGIQFFGAEGLEQSLQEIDILAQRA